MNDKGYTADGKTGNKCSAGGENGRLCLRCMPMVMGVSESVFVLCVQEPSGLLQVKQLCVKQKINSCVKQTTNNCVKQTTNSCVRQTTNSYVKQTTNSCKQ